MSEHADSSSGSDRLLESLWQDARREAEQKLASARSRADRLHAELDEHRERKMARALKDAGYKAAPETARIINRARGEVERRALEMYYRFLDECLETARALIREGGSANNEIRAAFEPLFRQALPYIANSHGLLFAVNQADLMKARDLIGKSGCDAEAVGDPKILGGVRIENAEGTLIIDNTVEGRLNELGRLPPVGILESTVMADR